MINIDIQKQLYGANGNITLDIKLQINKGEFIALTGYSGSGKTTFLRILAGLEKSSGTIKVNDKIWQNQNIFLPPQKRKIGFVFQDYALFTNMSVEENLLYAANDKNLAKELLQITNLYNLKDKKTTSLSGGQQQRVALCRAMMNKPELLLLDEPLSALDTNMRKQLQKELLLFHKKFNTTIIFVGHDLAEIYNLTTKVFTIQNGKIIQQKINNNIQTSITTKIIDIYKIDNVNYALVYINDQYLEIELKQNKNIGDEIICHINLT